MRLDNKVLKIAELVHELIRTWDRLNGVDKPEFSEIDQETLDSTIEGILGIASGSITKPSDSHKAWMLNRLRNGWKYGEVLNRDEKIHPSLVQYHELPEVERIKDHLFFNTVKSFYRADQIFSLRVESDELRIISDMTDLPLKDYHCTIAYDLTQTDLDKLYAEFGDLPSLDATVIGYDLLGESLTYLVLLLESKQLQELNEKVMNLLGNPEVEHEFKPHISLGILKSNELSPGVTALLPDLTGLNIKLDIKAR